MSNPDNARVTLSMNEKANEIVKGYKSSVGRVAKNIAH